MNARGALALVLCLLIGLCFIPTVPAGDTPGLLDFDPQETNADPGDTIAINVTLAAMAGYDDDGVVSFEYRLAYPPSVLSATNVSIGPWLSQEQETNVQSNVSIDEAEGRITIEQARDPPAGGVSDLGTTSTATLKFEVTAEADPVDARIQFVSARAHLLDFPLPVLTTREATISIDGGGETITPPGIESADDGPNIILADDAGTVDDRSDAQSILFPIPVLAMLLAALIRRWTRVRG